MYFHKQIALFKPHFVLFSPVTARIAGPEGNGAASVDPLFVPPSEDPLACLTDLQRQHDQSIVIADIGYSTSSLDILDHPLMLTDEVRSLLAVLAPWLAQQLPFLLVSTQCRLRPIKLLRSSAVDSNGHCTNYQPMLSCCLFFCLLRCNVSAQLCRASSAVYMHVWHCLPA